jgi:AraC-like DNA-binding protein
VHVVQLEQAFQQQSSPEVVRQTYYELFRRHPVAFRLRTNRLQVEPHAGNFSIKTVFSGAESYVFEDRITTVTPGQILFVKPDIIYSSTIRSAGTTDSFSLFLPTPFIQRLLSSRHVDEFLASPLTCTSLPGLPSVFRSLRQVAKTIEQGDDLGSDAALVELLAMSGAAVKETGLAAERLDVTTPRTRAELMRRLLLCRELLHAHVRDGISLARLSEETCLSEFHLMGSFRRCFGISVAQYLLRLRMERAAALIHSGHYSVAEVARRCGYSDLSAFGRAFRRHWGRSATQQMQSAAQRESALFHQRNKDPFSLMRGTGAIDHETKGGS